ncbi:oxidoreductase [Anaerobacillus alkalilacustris]|uniref:Oxidoreductase n=2 Tax=Anaerobacillus alkalilacustris TaxID=393763 RepID=A0A1S2LZ93_9BACI|nr:oxidoreductase [Anaerobacillus alkalilacustris]
MNCIVVGYGSIGQRHARILRELGCRVAVVSKRKIPFPFTYSTIKTALIQEKPDYIILANETFKHYASLKELTNFGFTGIILVEKPLFDMVKKIPKHTFSHAYVGYNLRFHPILQKISEIVSKEKILYSQIYVGQYLPNWRPNQDYRKSYSARKTQGGGVLLDLSHELDYARWLFGDWNRLVAFGGKFSSLQIDSDDLYSLMVKMNKCPMVQIHLNYLDRISRREISVITEKCTIKVDLLNHTLQINDAIDKYHIDRDDTYIMQHKAIMNGEKTNLCTLEEGLATLEMVGALEQSTKLKKWVNK